MTDKIEEWSLRFLNFLGTQHVCYECKFMPDKKHMSSQHLRVPSSQTVRMGGRQAWCCSVQTCSDRLHMPDNLEFISPPFLISAPVIQINSNEISRGKAPFGWGVCSSPQLSPIQRPFPPSEGRTNPPKLQHVEEWIWGAVTHRHWVSIQQRAWTPLLAWGDFP